MLVRTLIVLYPLYVDVSACKIMFGANKSDGCGFSTAMPIGGMHFGSPVGIKNFSYIGLSISQ